jgi:hypothetical protein
MNHFNYDFVGTEVDHTLAHNLCIKYCFWVNRNMAAVRIFYVKCNEFKIVAKKEEIRKMCLQ